MTNNHAPNHYRDMLLIASHRAAWLVKVCRNAIQLLHPKSPIKRKVELGYRLVDENRLDEAKAVFLEIRCRHPEMTTTLRGLAKIARREGDKYTELDLLNELLEREPDADAQRIRTGILLRSLGRYEEAEVLFADMLTKHPDDVQLHIQVAMLAHATRDYLLATQRWGELSDQYPEHLSIQRNYILSLLDIVEIDQAQDQFNRKSKTLHDPLFLSTQVDIFSARQEWDNALAEITRLYRETPKLIPLQKKFVRIQLAAFQRGDKLASLDEALAISLELSRNHPKDWSLRLLAISAMRVSGAIADALSAIDQLPDTKHEEVMRVRAWKKHMEGDTEGAKQVWTDIQRFHHILQAEPPADDELHRKDVNSLSLGTDEVILFTVVRNERWRLPWFLSYYRSLGVDRFFFVDNNSSDGTLELLLQQPDVHLFWTDESYAKSCSGMRWVNHLVEQYGDQNWCLYVDVDEALVFPGLEQSNLKKLSRYMTQRGQEALPAFMLDMFADHEVPLPPDGIERDFITHYPLFDNNYQRVPSTYCPYTCTFGGVRQRFTSRENLTKTPLIRGGRGIKFLLSSHCITPAVLSDVTGAVLHFKLAGDYRKIFKEDIDSGTRIPVCKRRHLGYLQQLEKPQNQQLSLNPDTLRYRSSEQLVELDLIQAPDAFVSWLKESGCNQTH